MNGSHTSIRSVNERFTTTRTDICQKAGFDRARSSWADAWDLPVVLLEHEPTQRSDMLVVDRHFTFLPPAIWHDDDIKNIVVL